MVRTTRTSIALKNSALSAEGENSEPPPPAAAVALPPETGATGEAESLPAGCEVMASGSEIPIGGSDATYGAILSPSMVLQKLPMEPVPAPAGSARRGPRNKPVWVLEVI